MQISIDGRGRRLLDRARKVAVAEFERLEQVFTIYDSSSEVVRWRRGEVEEPSADLAAVLALARILGPATDGAFNPAAERLVEAWRAAEGTSCRPPADELAAIVEQIAQDPMEASGLSLNAIAKGYIVDASVGLVSSIAGVERVTINAGGDIFHHGPRPTTVGIEDPRRPFDNVASLASVMLHNQALATSGSGRRGFVIDGTRFGHVIDPRTGQPVDHVLSASVVAPSAAVADALATAMMVLEPPRAIAIADSMPDVGLLIVGRDGTVTRNERWRLLEV